MMKKHKGSTLDSFLKEEGLLENAEAVAIKRVIAYELEKRMKTIHLNKKKLAEIMQTSRSALDRLLDPENTSITLNSLVKAARAMGKKIHISID